MTNCKGRAMVRYLALVSLAVAVVTGAALAQTANPPAGSASDPVAAEKASLEQQLAEQQARNEALRQRITKLEQVLSTDVCNNPEAAAILKESVAPAQPTQTQ